MGDFRSGGRSFGGRGRSGGSSRGFGGRGGFGERRPLQMHDATCSKCQKQCQIPFRPTGDRPVFCSDCFRSEGSSNSDSRSSGRSSSSGGISQEQFKQINSKLDKILDILEEIEFEDDEDVEGEDDKVVDDEDEVVVGEEDEDEKIVDDKSEDSEEDLDDESDDDLDEASPDEIKTE
jgi:CxxC-x17-CxxC domain-containing protein